MKFLPTKLTTLAKEQNLFCLYADLTDLYGNCEEELPKKPVGRQLTDSLPTANQQVTDRLRKKKNCVKNKQLT